jgi:DNA-binding PadR family transcriptional regulator
MRDPFNQPGRRHGGRETRRALHEHLHDIVGGRFGPPDGPDFPPIPPGFGPGFVGPGFGGPGGFGPGFGFGFGGPRGRGRGRGHRHGPGRARRGNVRAAVLILLAERPMHGYEMIQEISERSGGWWRPSPGSVYPTLQMLADEGLVTTEQEGGSGKRLYSLTEAGAAVAAEQDKTPPWEQAADDVDANDVALREAIATLAAATMQVAAAGNQELRAAAAKVLVDARRQLYLLLADAGAGPVEDTEPDDES